MSFTLGADYVISGIIPGSCSADSNKRVFAAIDNERGTYYWTDYLENATRYVTPAIIDDPEMIEKVLTIEILKVTSTAEVIDMATVAAMASDAAKKKAQDKIEKIQKELEAELKYIEIHKTGW